MRISILCTDGSPLGVTMVDIWGEGNRGIGIGGSELALLTMCEQWTKDGHDVTLYNDPKSTISIFQQKAISQFQISDDPDILIVFRSPNPLALVSKAKKIIWWSCDQYTQGSFKNFADALVPLNHSIVCISSFHAKYFAHTYRITNTTVIDIPIRVDDFEFEDERIKNRFIFTSVPDRGLDHLWAMWPLIKREIPDASLVITSDYRLWGCPDPRNNKHRVMWMTHPGVEFLGALPRRDYLRELCKADMFLYPCTYDELFCISCAEAQYAGAYPITSTQGALETTNMGSKFVGDPSTVDFRNRFIGQIKHFNESGNDLDRKRFLIRSDALNRFHPENIAKEWEKVFYE